MHNDIKAIIADEEKINKICINLAERINSDYQGKNPLFIGVLKGCLPFMSDLIKHVTLPCELDYIACSSYHGTKSNSFVELKKDSFISVKNRDVILVEDISDTGRTLNMLKELFIKREVKSFEVAVLLDKKDARIMPFTPKYIGLSVENDFIVGYGLDYNEKYRNLPYVGILKETIFKKNEVN